MLLIFLMEFKGTYNNCGIWSAFWTKKPTTSNGKIDTAFEHMMLVRVLKIISLFWSFYFVTFFFILSVSHENMKLQLQVKIAKIDKKCKKDKKTQKIKNIDFPSNSYHSSLNLYLNNSNPEFYHHMLIFDDLKTFYKFLKKNRKFGVFLEKMTFFRIKKGWVVFRSA